MKCSYCGKEFEGRFCPECGARVHDEMDLCPVCGKERNHGEKFCSNCGYKFEKQVVAEIQELQKSGSSNNMGNRNIIAVITKIYRWLLPIGMILLGVVSLLCLCAPTITEEILGMENNCCNGFVALGNGANVDVPTLVANASRVLLTISLVALIFGALQLFLTIKKPYSTVKKFPMWIIDGVISIVLIVLGSVVTDIAKKEGLNGKAGAGFTLCIVMGVMGLVLLGVRIFYELKVFKWEDMGLSKDQIEVASGKKEHKKLGKSKLWR